jgi:hypothetical protein
MQGRGALPSIPRGPKAQCASHGCDTLANEVRRECAPRNRRLMCYKSAGDEDGKSAVLEDGKIAVRPRRPISSRAATILARRPTSGMVGLQLKIVVSPSRRGAARLAGAIGPQLSIVAHFAPTGVAVFCRLFIGKLTTLLINSIGVR